MRVWSFVALAALTGCGELRSDPLGQSDAGDAAVSERFPKGDAGSVDPGTAPGRLDPLEAGRSWTYDVSSSYAACPTGVRSVSVLSEEPAAGNKRTFTMNGICGGTTVTYAQEGDVLEGKVSNGVWMRLLDEPVEDGHAWTTANGSSTVNMSYAAVPEVTTRAGTFTDCWKVTEAVAYRQSWTWCRDVGLVIYDFFQNGDGMVHYELVTKSF